MLILMMRMSFIIAFLISLVNCIMSVFLQLLNVLKPWISSAIVTSIKTKNRLYRLWLCKKSDIALIKYKKYINKLTHIIQAADKKYFWNRFSQVQDDIKATWRLIKSILTNDASKCNIKELYVNGKIIINPKTLLISLMRFFINIGTDLGKMIHAVDGSHPDYMTASDASMFLLPTTGLEIIDIARNLKPSKSPGYDEISTSN